MSRTSLRNTLESLTRDGYDLVLEGVVNVEGGALAAATERFAECDQCDGQEFEKALMLPVRDVVAIHRTISGLNLEMEMGSMQHFRCVDSLKIMRCKL